MMRVHWLAIAISTGAVASCGPKQGGDESISGTSDSAADTDTDSDTAADSTGADTHADGDPLPNPLPNPNADCPPGWGGVDCSVCEVGWGGEACGDCVPPYGLVDGVCADKTACPYEQTWILVGGLPEVEHQGADFAFAGTDIEPTVVDQVTGLEWRRCGVGQTWTGATCQGAMQTEDWPTALSACAGAYGGHADWRLPTYGEVESVLNYASEPCLDTTAFPNVPAGVGTAVWTASFEPPETNHPTPRAVNAVILSCKGWYDGIGISSNQLCVRGGAPDRVQRFHVTGDGATVLDAWIGVEWRRCAVGQAFDGVVCTGDPTPLDVAGAHTACAGEQSSRGRPMRLPTVRELRALRDYCHLPAFDKAAFPKIVTTSRFLTSTEVSNDADLVFQVDVDSTYVSKAGKVGSDLFALCVDSWDPVEDTSASAYNVPDVRRE